MEKPAPSILIRSGPLRQRMVLPRSVHARRPCRHERRTGDDASHHGSRCTTVGAAMLRRATEPLEPRLLQTSLRASSLHAALASGVRKLVTSPAAPARANNAAAAAVAARAARTMTARRRTAEVQTERRAEWFREGVREGRLRRPRGGRARVGGRGAGEGGADRAGAGDTAQVPREHHERPPERGPRAQSARGGGRLLARAPGG